MAGTHPEIELIGHLRDELAPAERARIETHLAACAECRRTTTAFQAILTDLRASQHPAAITLASAAAVALIALALPFGRALFAPSASPELVAFEEVTIGSRLDLLQQYQVVEHLDLLEDLDVISHLER